MLNQPEIEEPHIGSFIKDSEEEAAASVKILTEKENSEMEALDPDEKKDMSLAIVFTLVGALTLIAAFAFYINKYIQPSRTDTPSVLLIDSSIGADADANKTLNGINLETPSNYDGENSVTMTSEVSSSSRLDGSTFAKTDLGFGMVRTNGSASGSSTQNPNNIITEYIIRATSTGSTGPTGNGIGTNGSGSTLNSSASSTTSLRTDTLSEKVTSSALGITFLKDPFWKQTTTGDVITFKKVGPESRDVIYMKRFHGTSITTEDILKGRVTYMYDTKKASWTKANYNDPVSFVPSRYTRARKPIFEGTSQTATLIIALDINDFVIVNISGTGYSKILDAFVNEIATY